MPISIGSSPSQRDQQLLFERARGCERPAQLAAVSDVGERRRVVAVHVVVGSDRAMKPVGEPFLLLVAGPARTVLVLRQAQVVEQIAPQLDLLGRLRVVGWCRGRLDACGQLPVVESDIGLRFAAHEGE
jgi:hypothetical protein